MGLHIAKGESTKLLATKDTNDETTGVNATKGISLAHLDVANKVISNNAKLGLVRRPNGTSIRRSPTLLAPKPNGFQSIINLVNLTKSKRRDNHKVLETWTSDHTGEQIDWPIYGVVDTKSTMEEQIAGLVPDRGKKANPINSEEIEGHRGEDPALLRRC